LGVAVLTACGGGTGGMDSPMATSAQSVSGVSEEAAGDPITPNTTTSEGVDIVPPAVDTGTATTTTTAQATEQAAAATATTTDGAGTVNSTGTTSAQTAIVQNPMLPYVNLALMPAPGKAFVDTRVKQANTTLSSQVPAPDKIGAFREPCNYSHMAFDDPIVFPGQPGKSHLHVFFGNTLTNANSTAESLATTGNSTCAGGVLNRTAYWAPAMIDTATGAPVVPRGSLFYYKSGYLGIAPSQITQPPPGLRMITGDAKNTTGTGPGRFACNMPGAPGAWTKSIPACGAGGTLNATVDFPQCWDGVNLDSPDHKSHMANPVHGKCPSTHPVAIPVITLNVEYKIGLKDDTTKWRLASDMYDPSQPGGYSMHGDWFNAWDKDTMKAFIDNCEKAAKDCHAYLLGDGRMVY